MTREEIDAIYDAQQNSNPVNNAGITRAEIDAIFDSYEKPKKPVNSQKATKASVSPLAYPEFPDDEDVINVFGNVIHKAKDTSSKKTTEIQKVEKKEENKADSKSKSRQVNQTLTHRNVIGLSTSQKDSSKNVSVSEPDKNKLSMKDQFALAGGNGVVSGLDKDTSKQIIESGKVNALKVKADKEKNPIMKSMLNKQYEDAVMTQNQTVLPENPTSEEVSDALAKWTADGYKMTDAEKKQARSLFGNAINPGIDRNTLSDEDMNNLAIAYSKSNPLQNFMLGFGDNPVFNAGANFYTKFADVSDEEREEMKKDSELTDRMTKGAYTQQPIVTSGGKLAGSMAEYAIGSKVIGALPGIGSATQKAGQAIGKGAEKTLGTLGLGMADAGSKGVANLGTKLLSGGAQRAGQAIGNSAANVLGDSLVDVALDTVPNALNDAKNGASGKEVGINAAKNLAANIGFNAVGEAAQVIPYVGMYMKNNGRNDKAYAEAMDNIAKRNPLNPLENMDNTMKQNSINTVADYYGKDVPLLSEKNIDDERKKISSQLYEYRNGNFKPSDRIDMGSLPQYMQNYGDVDGKFLMDQSTIKKITSEFDPANDHMHGLSYEAISHIPDELNSPAAVMLSSKNSTYPSSPVAVTQYVDSEGNPIIMSVHMNQNLGSNEIGSKVSSMYGKNDFQQFYKDARDEGRVLFENKEKVNNLLNRNGLQLPNRISGDDSFFNNSISNSAEKVNYITENGNNLNKTKVSQVRDNTLRNSGIVTESELDKHFTKEQLSYVEVPEKESLEQAAIRLEQDADGWKRKLMNKDSLSGMDTDTLMMIYRDTVNAARSTNDEKLWSDASAIFKKIQKSSTNSAQALQALSKWSKNTPEGAILGIQNKLDQLVDKKYVKGYADTVNNLADKVESIMNSGKSAKEIEKEVSRLLQMDLQFFADKSYKNNVTGMKVMGSDKIMQAIRKGKSAKEVSNLIRKGNGLSFISDSDSRLIYDYLSAAQGLDANSREYKELLGKAGKIVANNIPSTFGEKAKSILYDNMLGNIKTALTRNMLGNAAYNSLEQVRQLPAAGIDWAISKKTGNRTTTGWNKEKTLAYLSGLKKGFTDQFLDIKNGVNTSKSGFATLEDAIANNKHAFKNPLLKLQNGIDNIVHYGMSFGDRPFYEAAYAQAKVEMEQIINKYGESALQTNIYDTKTIDEFIDTAAKCRALESVFQNDGKIAKSLNSIKKGIGELSDGLFGVDILSQTSSPFTFTPGNMISKAVEYSPFGIIKNAVGTGKEISKRSFNQRRFVDETSRNLMGTGLFGGAIAAYNADLISGGYSSDPDARTAQIASGEKEYALKLPNGGRIDIGDIPVLGPMAEAGARYVDAYKSGDNIVDASKKAMESIVGGSAMQGFNKVFGSNAYYETGGGVIDNIEKTVKSAGTQLVPALLRQTAQTTDNYKRDLGEYGTDQYYINSIKNQLPFLRETLPIKKDNEGIPVLQNQGRGMASKIFENYLSPLEYSQVQETELGAEARRIAETTGSNTAYAPTATRDDVRDLQNKGYINEYTEEVYREYKDELATLVRDMAGELIDTDFYNGLSDEYKTKALEDTYEAMRAVAKQKISNGKYISDNKIAKEFSGGGTKAAFDYMQNKYALSEKGISSSSKTAKAFYENGGEKALDVYSELKKNAANEQGKLDTAKAIQYLDGTNISDAEKGEYIYMINNSSNPAKGMTSAYNDYGYEGVYDYYKIKSEAVDYDKSGSPTNLSKEDELIPYLTGRTDLTNAQKNDYVNYFFPKNKNTYF